MSTVHGHSVRESVGMDSVLQVYFFPGTLYIFFIKD